MLFAGYTQFYGQMWVPATPFPGANGGTNNSSFSIYGWGCGGCPFVSNLKAFNNELYVGGYFNTIGGLIAHNIAKWNGTNWSTLGPGNFFDGMLGGDYHQPTDDIEKIDWPIYHNRVNFILDFIQVLANRSTLLPRDLPLD